MQYTQNREDAEEIAQDVFCSVHQHLKNFEGNASIKTWIYRITINKSLDFLKAKKSKKRWFFFSKVELDSEANFTDVSHFDHPGVLLEQKESLQTIFRGINQLPPQQKTALILLKIEGNSQKETAHIMETTTKAVEGLYQRAKKNLAKYLNQNKGL